VNAMHPLALATANGLLGHQDIFLDEEEMEEEGDSIGNDRSFSLFKQLPACIKMNNFPKLAHFATT
jgi:hypothetical protein